MAKWLAAATVVVLALLALLWIQIREPAAAVTPTPKADVAAAPAPASPTTASDLAIAAQKVREAQENGGKIDPASDAFTYRFDEQVPPMLTMQAAKCYTGGISRVHRNQKVKLGYNLSIKNGVVSVSDVRVVESTINDKTLVDCFIREVGKVTWTDDQLPDWKQDDELVIRPERGMKKFTAENLAYEGDGPIGKLESAGPVAASREQPLDQRDANTGASAQDHN
jgi:hypothetical protein